MTNSHALREPEPVIVLDLATYEKLLAVADARRVPVSQLGDLLDRLLNEALDRELWGKR